MGFSLTSPAPEKGDPTAEKRVWGFFGDVDELHRQNRPQTKQPRQGNRLTTTKIASGRTYWPNRDPLEELGGPNIYGFIYNKSQSWGDVLGAYPIPWEPGVDPSGWDRENLDDTIAELCKRRDYSDSIDGKNSSYLQQGIDELMRELEGRCENEDDVGYSRYSLVAVSYGPTETEIPKYAELPAKFLMKGSIKKICEFTSKGVNRMDAAGFIRSMNGAFKVAISGTYSCCICENGSGGDAVYKWTDPSDYRKEIVSEGANLYFPTKESVADAQNYAEGAINSAIIEIEEKCRGGGAK